MASICGEQGHVTLELNDGTVVSGPIWVAEIEQTLVYDDFMEWSIALRGIGDKPIWHGARDEALERHREQRLAPEWECDYCGAIWPKKTAQCVQCGGWRSFVYDV
jgi:hypothetical protein